MSKPLTKGPTIGVRLSLDQHRQIAELAAQSACSPAQLVSVMVERAIHQGQAPKVAALISNLRVGMDDVRAGRVSPLEKPLLDALEADNGKPAEHTHTKDSLIGGGLHKCRCGAVRDLQGNWR